MVEGTIKLTLAEKAMVMCCKNHYSDFGNVKEVADKIILWVIGDINSHIGLKWTRALYLKINPDLIPIKEVEACESSSLNIYFDKKDYDCYYEQYLYFIAKLHTVDVNSNRLDLFINNTEHYVIVKALKNHRPK